MKKTFKILIGACIVILLVVIAFILGLNGLKFLIYSDYYKIESDVCINPGLNDGFVCQGICEFDANGKILVSGYMSDHSASRIYVTDEQNNSYYVSITKNGKAFTGHAGGIASHGDKVYIVGDNSIYVINADDIFNAQNGDIVEILEVINTDNAGSSAFADENYLYVGEFHNGTNYVTEHTYTTPDGEYNAVIYRYSFDNLTAPDKIYSIRNEVQGICFAEGKIVLSTSYGLADSYYYVYNEADAIESGLTHLGAPVYYVCSPEKVVKGPAMAEGLDYYDGKVITLTESASNKYIFGKFFFADKIVALDLLKD